jgi:invasion protein IalB
MSSKTIIASTIAGAAIIAGGILLTKLPASNPPQTAPQPAGQTFDNWTLNCNEQTKKCSITQMLSDAKTGQKIASIIIGNLGPKGETLVFANTPLGIFLPAGIALKVDEQKQISYPLQNCTNDGCHTAFPLDAKLSQSMSEGKAVRLGVMALNQQSITITFNLKGFKEAFSQFHEKLSEFGPAPSVTIDETAKDAPPAAEAPASHHTEQPAKTKGSLT